MAQTYEQQAAAANTESGIAETRLMECRRELHDLKREAHNWKGEK
jgi:hypothetical protein